MSKEKLHLVSRDEVPDEEMFIYRLIMAETWFPGDKKAQQKYIETPGQAPMGNITQSYCLVDRSKVIGTLGVYDFDAINRQKLTSGRTIGKLPSWLTSMVYSGDLSRLPDYKGLGIGYQLTELMMSIIRKSRNSMPTCVFGITESNYKEMLELAKNIRVQKLANTTRSLDLSM